MKILRVIPSMNPERGGPSQGIRNITPEIKNHGIETNVVTFDNPEKDFLRLTNLTIIALGSASKYWKRNKKLIPWLYQNASNYDIIVIHGLWLYHSYATIKVIRKLRKTKIKYPRVYVMPHGMLDPYFQQATSRKIKALRNQIYWHLIEKQVVNNANGILFTCKEELLLARKTFKNYNPKLELNIGYGIQPPPTYETNMLTELTGKIPNWNGKPYWLFLSRIHEKKGVDLLINAYLQLEQKGLDLPQLIIAGPVNHTFGVEMQQLADASKNIIFAGMLQGAAKWGAFYHAEAFILPSHQENFGIAVVEAMACKKPVLISDKVNIWREIKDENAGLVVNDDLESVTRMLEQWLQRTESVKQEQGKNAFATYKKYFSIELAAKNFIEKTFNRYK